MKTALILITVVLGITAASPIPIVTQNASDRLAQHVLTALKKSSAEEYAALFPTLAEFHAIMDKNNFVYSEYLSEAKQEFAVLYENEVIPSLKKSFTTIIQEGHKKGIDWSAITFVRTECNVAAKDFEPVPFTFVFSANGKEYRLTIDKTFIMDEIWKVGSDIRLI